MVSAMFCHAEPGSLVFFLSDSDLQIQISKNELHCLLKWTFINYGELHCHSVKIAD